MEIIHLNEESFENEVLNKKGKVLVDFFATWCPPCKMLSPILEEIAKSNDDFQIAKVDIDECRMLTDGAHYNVMSVPTMVLFEDGKEVNRMVGFHSKIDILRFVED